MSDPVRIFYSYSHKDEHALDALKAHPAEVRRQSLIEDWHDRRIEMGTDWSRAIESALEEADLVLLVSSDFLASDYCSGIELKRAMQRALAGEARVLPVYLRPVRWKEAPFSRFQGLPTDANPVSKWRNREEAWKQVADGIVRAAREIGGEAKPKRSPFARSPGLDSYEQALALELDPGLPQALFGLGLLDQAEARRDAAQGHYRKALERAPGHTQYLTNLADLLLARRGHAAALDIYDRLLFSSARTCCWPGSMPATPPALPGSRVRPPPITSACCATWTVPASWNGGITPPSGPSTCPGAR